MIETVVADVHADVGTDHQEVEHIEDQNVPLLCERCHVCLIDELGRDARDVAEEDQTQKHQAFALCGSTLIGFEDVDGPGNAEADDHNDFKNFAHLIMYLSFFVVLFEFVLLISKHRWSKRYRSPQASCA